MKRSITLRLVAMFALATLATFALIGAALYGVLQRELMRHQHDELQTAYQDMAYMIKRAGDTRRWSHVQTKMDTLSLANNSHHYWVQSTDPHYQYGTHPGEVEKVLKSASDDTGTLSLPLHPYPLYTLSRILPSYQDRPPVTLTVGIDSKPYVHTLHTFLMALIALSLSAVLLVMLLGYWIAQVGLRPLKRLSNEAQTLSPRTLSQRLRIQPLPDELSNLANAFNGALGRLEAAYNQLEAFNADVAHELRTPLTNLIGGTQVALSRQRSAPQFQEVLQSNLEELERLRSIVNDMLFLARADQGEAATGLVKTLVAQEIGKTIAFLEFVLDESQETVQIEGDAASQAMIETSLFRRAMANLLQNAIEHSPPGAQIRVRIEQQPAFVRIAVSNPGKPIAPVHLPLLFDRFYRVDAARHNGDTHGHGLGLAIVKAVATMHGGDVFAASAEGVTTIGFSLPRAEPG
jgi:two-component system heavy metal sensor histidine kinase CusS